MLQTIGKPRTTVLVCAAAAPQIYVAGTAVREPCGSIRLAHAIGTITDGTTNYTPEPSPEDLFWPDATELIRSKIAYSSFNLIP